MQDFQIIPSYFCLAEVLWSVVLHIHLKQQDVTKITFEQNDLAAETGYCAQNTGSPMGSSISSIACEVFPPNMEENFYPEFMERDTHTHTVCVGMLFISL